MFKIKVNKKVGEVETIVEVETDNQNMVLAILRHCDVVGIDSDAPNRNVDPDWQNVMQRAREYHLPLEPFSVTC